MPTENTCTVHAQQTSPLKHAKSHYSLRPSTPTQNRSRAGTPTPRPSTPTVSSPLAAAGNGGNGVAVGNGNGVGGGGALLGEERTFTFDHCLWSVNEEDETYAGQEKLYDVLGQEFLQHSLEGYNCCIFACKSLS